MNSKIQLRCFLLVISFFIAFPKSAISQANTSVPLTSQKRSAIIKKTAEIFAEFYPIPEVSTEMIGYIDKRQREGAYDKFNNVDDFTSQLTKDMRSKSNDDHIRVYPYEKIPDDLAAEKKLGSPENNYGFQRVEILPGNIGYINLTTFINPKTAGSTAVAAMNFVAHCDALIIDLRFNGGGDEAMAQFLSSYFFDQSTHMTDVITPKDNLTEQIWTQEWVPGLRITVAPIYILMNTYSYSSAEVLAYQLQQIRRAKIVGEKTKGGVHGVRFMSFPDLSINLKVPYKTEINPYSKTNYINGVMPDITASSREALIVAHSELAKLLLTTETNIKKKYLLEWIIAGYEIDRNPIIRNDKKLAEYVGTYANVVITLDCSTLMLQRNDFKKQAMIPMGDDLFKFKDINEQKYRVQFIRDDKGKITGLSDLDSDGDTYPVKERERK
ncbi:MAG: S41 family peptidase [Candidatus Neomarinimicrobiota bacterium]